MRRCNRFRLSEIHDLSMKVLTKRRRKILVDIHVKDSIEGGVCHKERKVDVNRFDMEMTQLEERLSKLMEFL